MDGGLLHCTGDREQDHAPKKEIKKAMQMQKQMQKKKWLSEEALQIPVKSSEKQRRKGKIYPFECRIPKNSKER